MPKPNLSLTLCLAASAGFASAAEAPAVGTKDKSALDALWDFPTLYKNDAAAFLSEFRIIGRAHFDMYHVNSNLGSDQDWVIRRLRLGIRATFFHRLDLLVETELASRNPGGALFIGEPGYQRLTSAYLAWRFSDALKLTIGKQRASFTLDGSMSSNELLTLERNNLSNNLWFPPSLFSGVSLSGKIGAWECNTGFFSGGSYYAPQSQFEGSSKEFGNFNGGNF